MYIVEVFGTQVIVENIDCKSVTITLLQNRVVDNDGNYYQGLQLCNTKCRDYVRP